MNIARLGLFHGMVLLCTARRDQTGTSQPQTNLQSAHERADLTMEAQINRPS